LISSSQICFDSRCALPEEASPPVSATLNPILIGSCANAGAATTAAITSARHDARSHVSAAATILRDCMTPSR
jgi:hypothetical protein